MDLGSFLDISKAQISIHTMIRWYLNPETVRLSARWRSSTLYPPIINEPMRCPLRHVARGTSTCQVPVKTANSTMQSRIWNEEGGESQRYFCPRVIIGEATTCVRAICLEHNYSARSTFRQLRTIIGGDGILGFWVNWRLFPAGDGGVRRE